MFNRHLFVRLKNFSAEIISSLMYFVAPHPKAKSWAVHRKLCSPSWYHDFSSVGIETRLFAGSEYRLSQEDKQAVLFNLLLRAKSDSTSGEAELSMVDLFCADAFYSIYALSKGLVAHATGVDLGEGSGEGSVRMGVLEQAALIRGLRGLDERLDLVNMDVMNYQGVYDLCLCAGGLYHIADPETLIKRITRQTRKLLIIQTVIPSDVSELEPFFVSPAPHWSWGSRFNRNWLIKILEDNGWRILAEDLRPMRANEHNWDRLSLSLLCSKVADN